MNAGDIVMLYDSERRNGKYSGKFALVIDIGKHSDYVLNVDGEIKKFHETQIAGIINESR
jgi:hypothetical protein